MERTNTPLTKEAARKLMALDLTAKELTTYEKLDEWYTAWGGQCYVSFSGGKDSTVLAYLAARYLASFRTPPWELNLVFVNTGLEYPEIQKFVNEYSAAPAPVEVFGDSDFLRAVSAVEPSVAWAVMDELMDSLKVVNERVYNSVMRKLDR